MRLNVKLQKIKWVLYTDENPTYTTLEDFLTKYDFVHTPHYQAD